MWPVCASDSSADDDVDVMPGGRAGVVGVEPVNKALSKKPDATNYREKLGLKTRPVDDDEVNHMVTGGLTIPYFPL